eukprot:sb/3468724/
MRERYDMCVAHARVKHAALSALRNIAICEVAREPLRAYLPALLSYVRSDMPMLIFKAVACVRTLVRGSKTTATDLSSDTDLVKVIAELPGNYKYHNGIQGEAPRFLCTLIVEADLTKESATRLVSAGVVPVIISMTKTKEYPKIQVEGWLAIQKLLHTLRDDPEQVLLSARGGEEEEGESGLFSACQACLSEETNPNVRILALNIIRMVSGSVRSKQVMESLSDHLSRLAANDSDVPAQQLAREIQESLG